MRRLLIWMMVLVAALFLGDCASATVCVDCHAKVTPRIVDDWQMSSHRRSAVDCVVCHGDDHLTEKDFPEAKIPTIDICAACHEKQVLQFKGGKHARAWAAMKAMPAAHWQPMALREGEKGCAGCHRIGIKPEADIRAMQKAGMVYGRSSCDSCHTRHLFSVEEARQPQSCQTCHRGADHPQWEMYSGSRHGVRFLLKQTGILPETAASPTCQTCHMQEGDHAARTAWGFLGVRLPLPEDKQWAADGATILQGLGVLDREGKPAARLEVVKSADVARLSHEEWLKDREKMIHACSQCHSKHFAAGELAKGDMMIREADRLMAEAIRIVGDLYRDGILKKPAGNSQPFPDLLAFHDAPTTIEQKLFVMFFEHRMKAFQGTFHANPDYALRLGWSGMQRDLTEIRERAAELREKAGQSASKPR